MPDIAALLYISRISSWEIYMLEKKGQLIFKIPASLWIKNCERQFFPAEAEAGKR